MIALAQSGLPLLVLLSNLLFVFLFAAAISYKSWGREIINWLGRHAIGLGLLVSLAAVLGSLFYSNVVGFTPCELCWWQRVFIYPQLILFLTALKSKARSVFAYSWRLTVLAAIVAAYHQYTNLGGGSILPCSAVGGECSKLYVFAFGYITIPMMSLTIAAYLLLLAWANRQFERNLKTE